MSDTFQLEIVTPEKKVVDEKAEEVKIPGKNGYLGVLPGHAPLITELAVGEIKIRSGSKEERLAVAWGFAEVLPDRVTILAETAERQPELLARHCTEAGLNEQAAGLWGKAGQQSLARSALIEAAAQFTRALAQIAALPATAGLRRDQIRLQLGWRAL